MTGWVSYSRTGEGRAAGVLVVLARGPEGSKARVAETRTDVDGNFRFEGVGPGEHSFSTRTADGEPWDFEHQVVVLEPGGSARVDLWVEKPLPPATGFLAKGTVRYEDGRVPGDFHFSLSADGESHAVSGKDGTFERRLPCAGEYTLYDAVADGVRFDRLHLEIPVAEGKEIAVVLPVPRDLALVVVDRETGSPLPSARAHRRRDEEDDFVFDDFPNPETLKGEPLRADGGGRIALGTGTRPETCFVVADGHAWRKIEAARFGSGEVRVPLGPAGSVRLSVAGWDALADARVSAESSDPWRRWTLPDPGAGGERTYEGIPVATWTFRVRRGWDFRDGEVYGEGIVEVAAGAEAVLRIETKPSQAGEPVPVSGTVVVPAAWDLRRATVRFEGADPTNKSVEREVDLDLPGDGTPVPFRLDPLPPGDYEVDIHPLWLTSATVPPGGGVFDFHVPGPGTVLVRVVDDATDALLDGARVHWHVEAGRSGYGLDSAKRGEAAGTFRIRAPAGSIALSVSAPGFVDESVGGTAAILDTERENGAVPVREGDETTVTVRLHRAGSLRCLFRWEGEEPDWSSVSVWAWRGEEDGRGFGRGLNLENGVAKSQEIETGSWKVQVQVDESELEPVEDIPVEVKAGETREVVIRLVKRK